MAGESGELVEYYTVQWDLSKTDTCGPVITGVVREVAALQRYTAVF